MTQPLNSLAAITLFVEYIGRAKAWYSHAFDLPIEFEDDVSAVIKFENTAINLLDASAAVNLIAPSTVGIPRSESHAQFTIWVDNVDDQCAILEERGVQLLNGPVDREWGMRTVAFADPDGHIWELAQSLA